MVLRPKCETKTIQMQEENIGEHVCDCGLKRVFLDRTQKSMYYKRKKILNQTPQT